MSEQAENGMPWWGRELGRRIGRIEDVKPDVLAEKLDQLSADVKALKTAFYALILSVVGSAIAFAFTVFAQHGGGH